MSVYRHMCMFIYINIYPLIFRFFSRIGHYRVVSRVPCAKLQVLTSQRAFFFFFSKSLFWLSFQTWKFELPAQLTRCSTVTPLAFSLGHPFLSVILLILASCAIWGGLEIPRSFSLAFFSLYQFSPQFVSLLSYFTKHQGKTRLHLQHFAWQYLNIRGCLWVLLSTEVQKTLLNFLSLHNILLPSFL